MQPNTTDDAIHYFAAPTLVSLHFRYWGIDDEDSTTLHARPPIFESLLKQVVLAAPGLREVSLASDEYLPWSLTAFSGSRSLSSITIHIPLFDEIYSLTSLASLTELSLHNLGAPDASDMAVFQHFRSLEKVTLEGEPVYMAGILAQVAKSPSTIRRLDIHNDTGCSTTEMYDLFRVIKSHFDTSLEELAIDIPWDELLLTAESYAAFLLDFIRPLLGLRNLRVFDVVAEGVCCVLAWTNEVICAMASAWPRLTSLSVMWDCDYEYVCKPTLQCLPHLARSCPDLRDLYIMDIDWIWPATMDSQSISPHGLRTIKTYVDSDGSPAPNKRPASDVGRLLDRLFPSLDTGAMLCHARDKVRWKEVIEHVYHLQRARA